MKKVVVTLTGGRPMNLDDVTLMQDSYFGAIQSTELKDIFDTSGNYIISGCTFTINAGVNAVIAAGYVYIQGEVLRFDGATVADSGTTDKYHFKRDTATTTNKTYQDGVSKLATEDRKVLAFATSGALGVDEVDIEADRWNNLVATRDKDFTTDGDINMGSAAILFMAAATTFNATGNFLRNGLIKNVENASVQDLDSTGSALVLSPGAGNTHRITTTTTHLNSIGAVEGRELFLVVDNGSSNVIINDNTGAGKIRTPNGVDVVAEPGTVLLLVARTQSAIIEWQIVGSSKPLHGEWQVVGTAIGYAANWSGSATLSYRLNDINELQFKGACERGGLTGVLNETMFTLPADYRHNDQAYSTQSLGTIHTGGGSDVVIIIHGVGSGTPGVVQATSLAYTTTDPVFFDGPVFPMT